VSWRGNAPVPTPCGEGCAWKSAHIPEIDSPTPGAHNYVTDSSRKHLVLVNQAPYYNWWVHFGNFRPGSGKLTVTLTEEGDGGQPAVHYCVAADVVDFTPLQ